MIAVLITILFVVVDLFVEEFVTRCCTATDTHPGPPGAHRTCARFLRKKEQVLRDELRGKIGDTFSTPEAPQENPERREKKESAEQVRAFVKGKEEMGCGSSSPSEVAEMDNTDAPARGGGNASDLRAQPSLSDFDLSQLPKKTFTAKVPKRVGGGSFDFSFFLRRSVRYRLEGVIAHPFVTTLSVRVFRTGWRKC